MAEKRIISISRRTDIPGFYTPWLLQRLRSGFCHTFNPFGGQVYRVSLLPEDCRALVFWTRNPAPLIPHLDELDRSGWRYYFNYTLVGYPHPLETHSPPLETGIETFKKLVERVSPWRVQWRYDPILISSKTGTEYHLRRFERIARALEGYTEHCTFSFVEPYGKTSRNLSSLQQGSELQVSFPSLEEQRSLSAQLAEIANACSITFNACCSDSLVGGAVLKNRCISPEQIARLSPDCERLPGKRPTRPQCGCLASTDIGVYDTCLFGCAYCYATNSRQAAMKRWAAHDPADSILWRPQSLADRDLDERAAPLKLV